MFDTPVFVNGKLLHNTIFSEEKLKFVKRLESP